MRRRHGCETEFEPRLKERQSPASARQGRGQVLSGARPKADEQQVCKTSGQRIPVEAKGGRRVTPTERIAPHQASRKQKNTPDAPRARCPGRAQANRWRVTEHSADEERPRTGEGAACWQVAAGREVSHGQKGEKPASNGKSRSRGQEKPHGRGAGTQAGRSGRRARGPEGQPREEGA